MRSRKSTKIWGQSRDRKSSRDSLIRFSFSFNGAGESRALHVTISTTTLADQPTRHPTVDPTRPLSVADWVL